MKKILIIFIFCFLQINASTVKQRKKCLDKYRFFLEQAWNRSLKGTKKQIEEAERKSKNVLGEDYLNEESI